jgi:hypothetical protein
MEDFKVDFYPNYEGLLIQARGLLNLYNGACRRNVELQRRYDELYREYNYNKASSLRYENERLTNLVEELEKKIGFYQTWIKEM